MNPSPAVPPPPPPPPAVRRFGEEAVFLTFEAESEAARGARVLREKRWPWLIDVVGAYHTVAAFYDFLAVDFEFVKRTVLEAIADRTFECAAPGRLHLVPCCYDFALDFERLQSTLGLSRDRIIELHSGTTYDVHAIGFCPGFPYLGYLPAELSGAPRLETPRLEVEAGSVGLTGRQTGIYTERRPGGWNIVGRTPYVMVDMEMEFFPLEVGDRLKFEPISRAEFDRLSGKPYPAIPSGEPRS